MKKQDDILVVIVDVRIELYGLWWGIPANRATGTKPVIINEYKGKLIKLRDANS